MISSNASAFRCCRTRYLDEASAFAAWHQLEITDHDRLLGCGSSQAWISSPSLASVHSTRPKGWSHPARPSLSARMTHFTRRVRCPSPDRRASWRGRMKAANPQPAPAALHRVCSGSQSPEGGGAEPGITSQASSPQNIYNTAGEQWLSAIPDDRHVAWLFYRFGAPPRPVFSGRHDHRDPVQSSMLEPL